MVSAVVEPWDYEPPRKPRKVIVPVHSKYDLRALYYTARRIMFEREYPTAWAEGRYYDNAYPVIGTTNGATRYIQDVLNNYGHKADRINTTGIPTAQGWRKSGSTNGQPDISASIKIPSMPMPVTWHIEVKKGTDTLSRAQEKFRDRVLSIGGLHTVVYVGDMDTFWEEYWRIMGL